MTDIHVIEEKPIVNRSLAKSMGMKVYFTGKRCINGHLSEKITANGSCVECRNKKFGPSYILEYNRNYKSIVRSRIEYRQEENRKNRIYAK